MNSIKSQALKTNAKHCYKVETIFGGTLAVILLVQSAYILSIMLGFLAN